MKTYRGTEKALRGAYLSLSTGEFIQHEGVRALPGGSEVKYIKVPSALAVIVGPFAGLVFIIFLPFVGVVGIAGYLGYRLWQGVMALERRTLQLVAVNWQPGRAYFTRRGGAPDKKPEAKAGEKLDELEKEVDARKRQGEQ